MFSQMDSMGEKLGELEAERAELEKYNQADRTRRALQFTLWDADLTETQASLEQASLSGNQRQAITFLRKTFTCPWCEMSAE